MRQRAVGLTLVLVLLGLTGPGTGRVAQATGSLTDQRLDWKPCPKVVVGGTAVPAWLVFECTTFQVPRDWEHPEAPPRLDIAVSRLRPAYGPAGRVLFTNPGGPGAPGRNLPLAFIQEQRLKVLPQFDVIGIDVRGVGGSTSFRCGWHNETRPDIRDRRPKSIDAMLDDTELDARACKETGGDLRKFITTAQIVHDFDLLRRLLGREQISYLGFSAGTWLGAYYATYFPGRVDRFVLDSNVDFTSPWQKRWDRESPGYQRRFEADFLPYVARYHERFRLGRTTEEVRSAYERLRARLVDHPGTLGGREVNGESLDWMFIHTIARGARFQSTAEAFRDLYHGIERPPVKQTAREPRELALNEDVLSAIRCNDTPSPGNRDTLTAQSRRLGEAYPLLGWYSLLDDCVFWNRPALTMPVPTGQGVPPVLMVNSERDPATPLESARHAASRFKGARLLTVTGGEHAVYLSGNACVDQEVEAFLLQGKLPPVGASCPGHPILPPRDRARGGNGDNGASGPRLATPPREPSTHSGR